MDLFWGQPVIADNPSDLDSNNKVLDNGYSLCATVACQGALWDRAGATQTLWSADMTQTSPTSQTLPADHRFSCSLQRDPPVEHRNYHAPSFISLFAFISCLSTLKAIYSLWFWIPCMYWKEEQQASTSGGKVCCCYPQVIYGSLSGKPLENRCIPFPCVISTVIGRC